MTSLPFSSALEHVEYNTGPSVLIFSDVPDRRDAISAMVVNIGGRVSAALSLGEAIGRIADHAAPDGVIVDLMFAGTTAVDDVFDALDQGAHAHRFGSIAVIHPGMIDLAAARAGHRDVQLLCSPDENGLAAAIGSMLAPRVLAFNDISSDRSPATLRQLSDEVGRIARALAALSEHPKEPEGKEIASVDAQMIRAMIRARRLREQFLPADIFADPAWDMLLDLTAARLEGRTVAVSSLCIAAAVPPTTALRWIKTLTDLGLFIRVADPADRRRVFIELAPDISQRMLRCLAAMGMATGAGR